MANGMRRSMRKPQPRPVAQREPPNPGLPPKAVPRSGSVHEPAVPDNWYTINQHINHPVRILRRILERRAVYNAAGIEDREVRVRAYRYTSLAFDAKAHRWHSVILRNASIRVSKCCSRTYRPSTRANVPAARGWPLAFSRIPSDAIATDGLATASFTISSGME